jgi:hypothetical protein
MSEMRTRIRGATLAEVMVVASVFFVLLAAIFLIYTTSLRARSNIDSNSDIDRTLIAAARHLDATLRSSRLLKPDDLSDPQYSSSLELQPFKKEDDGQPSVTSLGYPEWGDPFTISFEGGELVRLEPNRRVFAKLGEGGYVKFIRPTWRILQMEIKVEREEVRGAKVSRESTFRFRLFNQ